jgi:methionine-rich copper-binding protein CopC
MMKSKLLTLLVLPVAALALVAARPTMWHLHLLKSEPAANDTLHAAPAAIRLWFSSAGRRSRLVMRRAIRRPPRRSWRR